MLLCIIIGIVIVIALAACSRQEQYLSPERYYVIKPIVKTVPIENEYVAEIVSIQYVEVRSRVKGYIEKVHVDEGQFVREGQLLFTVSNRVYQQELHKAEAALKNAIAEFKSVEVELANVRSLAEKNIVSKAELKMIEAKAEALKAKIDEEEANREQAAIRLSYSKITAPYTGVINRILHKVGSLIEEGTMLTSISDNREVFAYFHLSESDYLNYIQSNDTDAVQRVNLILANNTPYRYEGRIEIIESEFDRSTGNIAFRARFPNPERILKHGANGKVIVREHINNAMLIPQKSTFEVQDQLFVFVVKPDSTLEQRNIRILFRLPHYFVVQSGLNVDDIILYEGVQNVKSGDKVSPYLLPPDSVAVLLSSNQPY
ncbi:MAG: efflux RND transporter periplasmic adaptor subunit [Bacteroidota bacterium]|nr:efflux RND transporter periplasmic adaptor subunit [Candidatus Kapabacteria bacterium]MDW8219318.1 efflux RND transporter periplasmic adaptor subunit [Bacteroidota bacterium]